MHDPATRARVDAIARQADSLARAARHAADIDRTVQAVARATGEDPAGFVVLTPGSPEWVKAARDLQRARAP